MTALMPPDPLPVMSFESTGAWDKWLAAHHADSPGLWLKIAKKGAAGRTVSYSEALDVALCHGWIDGRATFTIVLSTPKMNRLRQQMARTSMRRRRLSLGTGSPQSSAAS